MADRIELTLAHHGVPIGTVVVGAENRFPEQGEDFAGDTATSEFIFLPFVPSPGYESLRPAFRLAYRAFSNHGFLGPAADPASDWAGRRAIIDAPKLCSELELRDVHGTLISGRVITFFDCDEVERPFWVDIVLGPGQAGA